MSKDSDSRDGPARRNDLTYGGVVVAGGLLAGCAGGESTGTGTGTGDSPISGSYIVEMAPMVTVEFDGVLQDWVADDGGYVGAV